MDRIDLAPRERGEQGGGIGPRALAPVAFDVVDVRAALLERGAQVLAAADAAEDDHPPALHVLQFRAGEERLAVEARGR